MERLEVLVTTMGREDFSLYGEMGLATDALIANQGDRCADEETLIGGHRVRMVSTKTRGLAVNRNIALMHARGDLLLFADDDQVFEEGYEKTVLDTFAACPEANAVKFYCASENPDRAMPNVESFRPARLGDVMAGGVHALAVRRSLIEKYSLLFPIGLGAGTYYNCGEDSVFLKEMIDRRLGLYVSPVRLASVRQSESSWFTGYDEKYFITRGYLYGRLYGPLAGLAVLRRALRKSEEAAGSGFSFARRVSLMREGLRRWRGAPGEDRP